MAGAYRVDHGALVLTALPATASAQTGGPRITRAPALSAVTYVGQRIDATGATWTGRGAAVGDLDVAARDEAALAAALGLVR